VGVAVGVGDGMTSRPKLCCIIPSTGIGVAVRWFCGATSHGSGSNSGLQATSPTAKMIIATFILPHMMGIEGKLIIHLQITMN